MAWIRPLALGACRFLPAVGSIDRRGLGPIALTQFPRNLGPFSGEGASNRKSASVSSTSCKSRIPFDAELVQPKRRVKTATPSLKGYKPDVSIDAILRCINRRGEAPTICLAQPNGLEGQRPGRLFASVLEHSP